MSFLSDQQISMLERNRICQILQSNIITYTATYLVSDLNAIYHIDKCLCESA